MALGTKINVLGIWRNVRDVYVKVNGTWRTVPKIYSNVGSTWKQVHSRTATVDHYLTITASTNNYNILAALGVTPTLPVNIQLTINLGVVVGSATASQPAITTGALPPGSTITIINNGYIIGKGGNAGNGAGYTAAGYYAAAQGGAGSSAIEAGFNNCNIAIDNSNGYIFGGGGGGGGGGFGYAYNATIGGASGSGGGGGAGNQGGVGGGAGANALASGYYPVVGNPGTAGSTAAGLGGAAAISNGSVTGGYGGNGGNYGQFGLTGGNGTYYSDSIPSIGATGGAPGKAVNYGIFTGTLTWLAGATFDRVKGSVVAPTVIGGDVVAPGHLFWRIYITSGTVSSTAHRISEITMHSVIGGQNVAVNGTPFSGYTTCSNGYGFIGGSGGNAAIPFNGVQYGESWDGYAWAAGDPYFSTQTPCPVWIGYQFSTAVDIKQFTISYPGSVYGGNSGPVNFELQWSDGPSGPWTTAAVVTGQTWTGINETRTYNV